MPETDTSSTVNCNALIKLIIDIIVIHIKIYYVIIENVIKLFLPKNEVNVANKVVLITGSGHGMGKEMALQYAKLGAKVICWDINEQTNANTVKEIKGAGGIAFGYTCNVTKRSDVQELAAKVKKEHDFVDIIVNNAGIMPTHPLLKQNEDEIKLTYDINVLSHFWILQAFLPDMLKRNEGHIVAISSCAGLFGLFNLVPYCGSKFAVRGVMRGLAEELRSINSENNIKLTTIYPYMVDTGLCKRPRYRFSWLKLIHPQDAAAAIIKAQRTGLEECTIPGYFMVLNMLQNVLPHKACRLMQDFFNIGIDSDL